MGFATRHNVPVHCNQWGVKDEVYDSNGRQQYARAMLNLFSEHKISSTYWLWRSYKKEGRDVTEPVWGFELTHNDGPHEALDEGMLSTLQEGFVKTARANSGNVYPCGAAAAGVDAGFEVAPLDGTAEAKALTLAQQPPVRFATPPLSTNSGDSGVECDPLMLEMRIDWSLLEPSSSTGTPKRTVDWPAPPGMLPAGASTVAPPSPGIAAAAIAAAAVRGAATAVTIASSTAAAVTDTTAADTAAACRSAYYTACTYNYAGAAAIADGSSVRADGESRGSRSSEHDDDRHHLPRRSRSCGDCNRAAAADICCRDSVPGPPTRGYRAQRREARHYRRARFAVVGAAVGVQVDAHKGCDGRE